MLLYTSYFTKKERTLQLEKEFHYNRRLALDAYTGSCFSPTLYSLTADFREITGLPLELNVKYGTEFILPIQRTPNSSELISPSG